VNGAVLSPFQARGVPRDPCPAGCIGKRRRTNTSGVIPMSKLSDTQLIILCAASQRDDRGVELPRHIKGEAARKVVDKLIRAGLLEEVRGGGSLPFWPRDLPPLAKSDDSKTPAKELFGRKTTPAPLATRTIGFYAKGCLAGAVALPTATGAIRACWNSWSDEPIRRRRPAGTGSSSATCRNPAAARCSRERNSIITSRAWT
jgi:hypothetical protein